MYIVRADRLNEVHRDLRRLVHQIEAIQRNPAEAWHVLPFNVFVLEGLRTKERQRRLFSSGASKTMKSRHLTGHAVDLAPYADFDGNGVFEVSWHWPHYNVLAAVVKLAARQIEIPVEWGGDWITFKDGPHWQLPTWKYPA